ncbi:MAG TPA: class 1 fructose-bisphosphatase [Bacteroidales bacterium]|nr:class 1 fructose-bisphosphatase [Bacteroidales bacterium]HQQ12082.1 class 1 fructose-bisphosphatase [Bacteroidales bacterium]
MKTLVEFIWEQQENYGNATGEFSRLLNDMGIAGKIVNRDVNRAGLAEILGYEGTVNVQGESQKKLDVIANNEFIKALRNGRQCAAIISEENDEIVAFDGNIGKNAKYIVAIDPLDGSSNIEVNVPIGTIFAIYKRKVTGEIVTLDEILNSGIDLVCGGYIIYGSSTMMVYTTGNGVNGFTYDPTCGIFILSHENMKITDLGNIYSINEANYLHFPEGVKRYIKYCQEDDPATNRPYTTRYIGSLISDFHRNMLRGGIYIYPGTKKNPQGKLRLMYECIPVAFLAEQAGGKASDGFRRILDIPINNIHQRCPLFIGSKLMVEKAEALMREHSADFLEQYMKE